MGTESIQVSGVINASADQIYEAWLDAHQHSKFTGGTATVEPGIGGKFTAWDGYIQGTTLELEPGRRIVQAWRTTEFPPESPDSLLEVVFEPIGDATRITLRHSEIPEGQGGRYEQGWKEHYLTRMTKFFGEEEEEEDDAAAEDSLLSEVLPPPLPVEIPAKAPKPKVEKAAAKAASPKKASAKPKSSPKRAKPAKAARAKKRPAKKAKKKSGKKSAKKKSTKKSSKKAKKSTRSKKRR